MDAQCIEQHSQHGTCGTCCHLQVLRTTWDVTSSTEGQTKNAFIDTLCFFYCCVLYYITPNISRLMFFFFLLVYAQSIPCLQRQTNVTVMFMLLGQQIVLSRPFFTHVHAASLHFQSKIQSCMFFIHICVLFCVTRHVVK